jgi:hypothetical protein
MVNVSGRPLVVMLAPLGGDRYSRTCDAWARPGGSWGDRLLVGEREVWTSEAAVALLVGASVFDQLVSLGSDLIQLAAACIGLGSAVLLRRQMGIGGRMNNDDDPND